MTLTDAIQKCQKYSSDSQHHKNTDNVILKMLTPDMQLPKIVEDKAFNILVLDFRYQLWCGFHKVIWQLHGNSLTYRGN